METSAFDPAGMAERAVTLVVGGRHAAGKPALLADLLRRRRGAGAAPFESGALVCEDAECRRMFAPHLVHDEYRAGIVSDAVAEQKRLILEANAKGAAASVATCHVVLDDVLELGDLAEVFLNGRQLRVNAVVAVNPRVVLPPMLGSNVDYVFVLRVTETGPRRRLYEMYANSPLLTFEAFESALDRATRDGGCLVIDCTVHSKRPEDFLFHYRGGMLPPQTPCEGRLGELRGLALSRAV